MGVPPLGQTLARGCMLASRVLMTWAGPVWYLVARVSNAVSGRVRYKKASMLAVLRLVSLLVATFIFLTFSHFTTPSHMTNPKVDRQLMFYFARLLSKSSNTAI